MGLSPSLVENGRRLAESLMVDEAQIFRSGGLVLDPDTGNLTPSVTTVYDGVCRVRAPNLAEQTAIFGGTVATTIRYVVSIPWTAPAIKIGDVVKLTATEDPQLAEMELRIVSVNASTYVMRRTLGAEVNA